MVSFESIAARRVQVIERLLAFRRFGDGAVHGHLCRTRQSRRIARTAIADRRTRPGRARPARRRDRPESRLRLRPPTGAESRRRDEIVVTGIRQSLANAQAIKRNSDTVVDAITAQDIGALPDRSVTEALQRVPGVAINRFAGSNDPDHFSVEGSGVIVRGLNFVRSEFNGRDTFSAGVGGQAINFADVPAELLGSVEVYKNTTAEMIEGGLAGTVNLNTRKPFDNKGLHIGVDAEANYGDFEKKWSPTGSLLISDTWDTGIGKFGLLADVSYSRVRSRADGIQVTNFQTRDNTVTHAAPTAGPRLPQPAAGQPDTTTLPPGGSPCGTAEHAGSGRPRGPAWRRLCADRRPVPHAGFRSQARRSGVRGAVREQRSFRADHRAVPAHAHHQQLGRTHVRDGA